mgnify:CR=1 FL=1
MNILRILVLSLSTLGLASACWAEEQRASAPTAAASAVPTLAVETLAPFEVQAVQTFRHPWAMGVLPGNRLLVTEKSGKLWWADPRTLQKHEITGVPAVEDAGQGGLGDVVLHPDFDRNQWIYLSYAEAGEAHTQGAAVARAPPRPRDLLRPPWATSSW